MNYEYYNFMLKPKDISKTFCILPWIHLSTRPNGHLRYCCTACASSAGPLQKTPEVGYIKNEDGRPANLNVSDLLTAWNNDYMKSARRMMLKGEIPASCAKCFKEEAAGYQSKRVWETKYWAERVDLQKLIDDTKADGSVPPRIYYVDLRMGTKCDLKCIMCSPHDSSMWIEDWLQLYPQIKSKRLRQIMVWDNYGRKDGATYDWHKNNPKFWQQFYEQIPHLKQLYFAGGEAIIIEAHYDLLKECIKRGYAKNIELRYNSNGLDLQDRLFELWQHFKKVRFHFSLDSFGAMNNYIRYPADWQVVLKNLERLDNSDDHIEVTLACAVQMLNMFYLPDFIKWKLSMKFKKINAWPLGAGLINTHLVYHPAHLNIKVYPQWFKEKVKEKFNEFFVWLKKEHNDDEDFLNHSYGIERLKGMVNFMESEDWSNLMPEFREYIFLMDKIRKTNFSKTFPEMRELMEKND